MLEALHYEFMRNAVCAGLAASLICGVIGSLVVVNRLAFLAGGVAHAAYGGVGLAFFLGWPVLPTVAGFTVAQSLLMARVSLTAKDRADTFIGVMWACGMALGVILVNLTPGYNADLMSYLFGSILAVPAEDLSIMLALGLAVLGLTLAFYKGFVAMAFDEEFARTRGVPTRFLYYLLLALVALAVVMVIHVVGLILVIALLTVPPSIAERRCASLKSMMALSCLLSAVFCLAGLALSYALDLASGATIIAVAALGFFLSQLFDRSRAA